MPKLEKAAKPPATLPPAEAKAEAEKPREGLDEFAAKGDTVEGEVVSNGEVSTDRFQEEWDRNYAASGADELDLTTPLSDTDEYVSVLYWGPYGTAKTTHGAQMATLPGAGKMIAINAEGGFKATALRDWDIDPTRIIPYPRPGVELTYERLEALFYRMARDLAENPGCWLGTMWDSATAIHQYLLDQVIDSQITEQREIIEKARKIGKRAGNITLRNRFETDRDDYATMTQQFRHLLRRFRYLPCHMVITALVREDKGQYGPAVNPALQNELAGYVDLVIRTGIVETPEHGLVWFGRVVGGENESNKDRFHKLPPYLVNPTFPRILEYVRGDMIADEDELQRMMDGVDVPRVGQVVSSKPARKMTAAERRAEREAKKAELAEEAGKELSAASAPDEAQAETPPPSSPPAQESPAKPPARARKSAAQRKAEKAAADQDRLDAAKAAAGDPDTLKSGEGEEDKPPY